MTKRIISTAAALALSAIVAPASAEESGAVYGKGVGALAFETLGVATSPAAVRRQGGFATAGAVEWKRPSSDQSEAGVIHGVGSIGALALETRGFATSASDVRRQGGAMTAGTVRWVSAPAR